MTKPDFIIIGAMKSATSTLHSQLELQPGIFMTTPKEPNFFSDEAIFNKGFEWYESLFDGAADGDLCGESSTHYTKLPDHPKACERIAAYLDKPKFIYVMRHPIDRLVSHYTHQWTENVFKCDINDAIEQYEELIAYSSYSRQLEPYFKAFGRDAILPIFTESIRKNPQRQLEHVASFIGYEQPVNWQFDTGPQNVSKERVRRFKGYDLLIESNTLKWLRQNLVPQSFRDAIKQKFMMTERPVINDEKMAYLTEIFDKDLAVLGSWLNIELTCENFKLAIEDQALFFSVSDDD
jgi:hypothetical protein